MCRSARAGAMASSDDSERTRGVMRMEVGSGLGLLKSGDDGSLSRPDDTTLAGLCWEFVKPVPFGKIPAAVASFPLFYGHSPLDRDRGSPTMSFSGLAAGVSR